MQEMASRVHVLLMGRLLVLSNQIFCSTNHEMMKKSQRNARHQPEPRGQLFAVPRVLVGQPDDVLVRGVRVGMMLHRPFGLPNAPRGLLDER
jgi:hypothetical protein